MSTKQEIKDRIDLSLGNPPVITDVDLLDLLKDATDNILDNSYATEIVDNEGTTNVLTTAGSSIYQCRITKQGRRVNINGTLTGTTFFINILFTITNAEFEPDPTSQYHSIASVGNDLATIEINGNNVFISTVLSGEIVKFNITYNTKD